MQSSNYPPNIDYLDTGIHNVDEDQFQCGDLIKDVNTNDEYLIWSNSVDGDEIILELIRQSDKHHFFHSINYMTNFIKL